MGNDESFCEGFGSGEVVLDGGDYGRELGFKELPMMGENGNGYLMGAAMVLSFEYVISMKLAGDKVGAAGSRIRHPRGLAVCTILPETMRVAM
ncbi:hypothetical protein V6N11_011969 [Hibiscus sabdariffa]|uniref:Uncharacterized protein n=2 Tax=Hibiscus sabdariffa TaxID=183260 RepID=A0ABR2DEF9_9ROSI